MPNMKSEFNLVEVFCLIARSESKLPQVQAKFGRQLWQKAEYENHYYLYALQGCHKDAD